jgi:hypothetical protein
MFITTETVHDGGNVMFISYEDDRHRRVIELRPNGSVFIGWQFRFEKGDHWSWYQDDGATLSAEEMAQLVAAYNRAAREQAEAESRAYIDAHSPTPGADRRAIALANVSGALVDSGVVVSDDETRYGEAVREIIAERDRLARTVDRKDEQMAELQEAICQRDRRIAELEAP